MPLDHALVALRRATMLAAAGLAAAALAVVPVSTAAGATPRDQQGTPPTELMGDGPAPIPLKDQAMIENSPWGLRFIAGQQDSSLTITYDQDTNVVTYSDTGTAAWRSLPNRCTQVQVDQGIAADCRAPRKADRRFLQVWPRLGDDVVDAHTLPGRFQLWVLADDGDDRVIAGDGNDFVNAAQGSDSVDGGAGNDWLRLGLASDVAWGGPGDDYVVGQDAGDEIHGGAGADRLYGSSGRDELWGDEDSDRLVCAGGLDVAHSDAKDTTSRTCEKIQS